jgi:hypothetical protein
MLKKQVTRFLFLLAILSGCTSTRITSRWSSPEHPASVARNILVMAIVRWEDRSIRETMERHLAEDLRQAGFDAVSSWEVYGPKAFDHLSEEEAIATIRNSGYDAVLTIVLLNKDRERSYYPGTFYFSPFVYYYNNWWGYQMMMMNRVYQPGYYMTSTRYFWESNLYEMATQQLVYSVQTRSFDPSSTESMAHEYGEMIAGEIVSRALVKRLP